MPGRATSPPTSQVQRRAFYAAAEGKSRIGIPQKVGEEKVAAGHGVRGLPQRATIGKKHDHTPGGFGGFAHAGTTVEGPHLASATTSGKQAPGAVENKDAFFGADEFNKQPHEDQAGAKGKSATVAARQEPKAFANSGTSRPGPTERGRASSSGGGEDMGQMRSIRRKIRKHASGQSGANAGGFATNTKSAKDTGHGGSAGPAAHFDVNTQREGQPGFAGSRDGRYEAGRTGNWSPTDRIRGERMQQDVEPPGKAPRSNIRIPAQDHPPKLGRDTRVSHTLPRRR